MGQITVYAAVANAAVRLPPGRDRRLVEIAAAILNDPNESDIGARILDFVDDDSTAQIGSICPHCKREPCVANAHMVQFGMFPALQMTCSGCRKILGYSIIPPVPMQQPQGDRYPGLILPPH